MVKPEKPDDGLSAEEAVEEGFGTIEPSINDDIRTEAIFPNSMGPGVIAPIDRLDYGDEDLPPEVDPSRAGLNNDANPDDPDRELDRLMR